MLTVEIVSPIGRLTLRRAIEESYQFLQPLRDEGHQVKRVLLDPHGDFQACVTSFGGPPFFTITLPLADILDLNDAAFLLYLTRRWIECMPDSVRAYGSDAVDKWAVQFGKPTRRELLERLQRLPIPAVGGAV